MQNNNTKINNAIIALFIGMQKTDLGWYDSEGNLSQYLYSINGGNTFDFLDFDKSYDWIMSAIEYVESKGKGIFMFNNSIEICENTSLASKRLAYVEYEKKFKIKALNEAIIQYINGNETKI